MTQSMHRFIEFRTIGRGSHCDLAVDGEGVVGKHARAALRADGALWLLGAGGDVFVDRGSGWRQADRLQLCAGDRIRLGETELPAADICRLFGTAPTTASSQSGPTSRLAGIHAPQPLFIPGGEMTKQRRNPDTGQLEQDKVSR
ncbi:MAG: FHA domain-containing protein [Xanthomonadales bacterium]|nr:FHA domain-containing protein [Xanthomonadales bacterium]